MKLMYAMSSNGAREWWGMIMLVERRGVQVGDIQSVRGLARRRNRECRCVDGAMLVTDVAVEAPSVGKFAL